MNLVMIWWLTEVAETPAEADLEQHDDFQKEREGNNCRGFPLVSHGDDALAAVGEVRQGYERDERRP